MGSFVELLVLSLVMGLSIFLSLPLVLHPRAQGRFAVALNAGAIGILVFLLADIYGDVAPLIADPNTPYLTLPVPDAEFLVPVVVAFLGLLLLDSRRAGPAPLSVGHRAFVIALAMGFQNLTEGLVFGAAWAAGILGLLAVIFTGFLLQNITEGFPIAAPYLGEKERPIPRLVLLFLLGGVPTVIGSLIGYSFQSTATLLAFDGAAIGAILYVILPMVAASFRMMEAGANPGQRRSIVALGILAGFALGFLVNAV